MVWGRSTLLAAFLALLFIVPGASAQKGIDDDDLAQKVGGSWCGTQVIYDFKNPATNAAGAESCPGQGDCDAPAVRDSWVWSPGDPVVVINVYFHVFRNDDGSNQAASGADVAAAVDAMNQQYAPYGFQFEYDWRFVNDTRYRDITTNGEFDAMKNLYAIAPDSQCNIYVVAVNVGGSVFSFATFPWDSDALTKFGGIVMNRTQFPPFNDKTLTHEMGHCLGLWHTHHGVDEVSQCGGCYESPGGGNGDVTGDFCSDTDPTPTNFSCGPPGGTDPCTGNSWGSTMPQNFMGYGPGFCRDEFSVQQTGRMQCWTDDVLTSWLNNVRINADTVLGSPPLTVNFLGVTPKSVSTWEWAFGDGGTSDQANPTYIYEDPGFYDVSVTIQATDGEYSTVNEGYIWVESDTMLFQDTTLELNQSVPVNVYARNYVPVRIIDIPFAYDGPLDLVLDSITTTGLRTEYLDFQQKISGSAFSQLATYRLRAGTVPHIPPGNGPVATMWFTQTTAGPGLENQIRFISYSSYEPKFFVDVGEYIPETIDVTLDACIAGDVNGDGNGGDPTDLGTLVDHLFTGGPLPNPAGADVNGDGAADPIDLAFLVDFLFSGGPAPTC